MSTVELHAELHPWPGGEMGELARPTPVGRGEKVLPVVAGIVLLGVDVALIFCAFVVAYWVRFMPPEATAAALGFDQYATMAITIAGVTAVLMATHHLFDLERPGVWSARVQAITSSVSTALVLVVAASYFVGEQAFSRLWFASGWAFAILMMVMWRSVAYRMYGYVRDVLAPANRVLIVGANRLGQELATELQGRYDVVGYVDNGSDLDRHPDLPLLGPISQLEQLVQAYAVHELVIALPTSRREQVQRVIDAGFHRPVTIKFLSELSDILPKRFDVHEFGGRRYIGFAPMASVSWLKRAIDLLVTALGVAAISPLLVAIAIAIKLDSSGPVFYRQQRVGKNSRTFWIYKFRSMGQDAEHRLEALRDQNEASGPLFKIRADPRVTRVGRFIRRWSLDELPQLFNVLRGEMSLVGPRPPLPSEVAKYEDWQLGRLRAVPGLTGLWQVSGRSEVTFHDMVRLDIHYIRNWSLGLDVEILLRTIPAVLTSRGAY
ncbi:MAG: sugar transferase [Chloroflexota bacterium]|nr:sugar transferase [Chloroflexota bacterium]